MLKRIGKGPWKVKRQDKNRTRSGSDRAAIKSRICEPLEKRDFLFNRLVILDTDLVGDAGMAVSEVLAFSVADDLS